MAKSKLAKLIRAISTPPFIVTAMVCILYFRSSTLFEHVSQAVWVVVFLGIVPALAYPCQILIPAWRKLGRNLQRKLAFIFSSLGYSAALIWSLLSKTGIALRTLTLSYFLSVVILIILNKIIRIKASGHSCSATAPVLFMLLYAGWIHALIWCVVDAAVIWASLFTKRHTVMQLILGAVTCMVSLCLSLLITGEGAALFFHT